VITKGGVDYSVRYSYNGEILLEDYKLVAPSQVGLKEDVVDMPFADAAGGYYGNLYGNGTANYMVTLNTRGFADDDTNTLPGMMLVLNLFDELPKGDNKKIVINPGTYTVQTYMNAAVGTMLYGLTMSDSSGASSPFGTFFYQVTAEGQQSVEFIDSGTLKVDHDDDADGDEKEGTRDVRMKTSSMEEDAALNQPSKLKEFASAVPDYIRNPSRYTHYTFDSSTDMDDKANKEAYMSFLAQIKASNASSQTDEALDDLPSVTFIPKKKSGDVTMGENETASKLKLDVVKEGANKKTFPVSIAAIDDTETSDVCAMEEDEQEVIEDTKKSSQKSTRKYRKKTEDNLEEPAV
jgi:hypothetical protein